MSILTAANSRMLKTLVGEIQCFYLEVGVIQCFYLEANSNKKALRL